MIIEQQAREEASDLAAQAGVTGDWFVDVLTVKLMKWYHKGGVDAFLSLSQRLGPKGETNIVQTLQECDRIIP